MNQESTQRFPAPAPEANLIGRKKLYARSYVVRQVACGPEGGFRNLYEVTDGTEVHIACLQIGRKQVPGGITVYREAVPSALILWLIGLKPARQVGAAPDRKPWYTGVSGSA